MQTSTLPRLKLDSPRTAIETIPYLLGFHPRDSAVMLGLSQSGRVIFTSRIDLPQPDEVTRAASTATEQLKRNLVRRVLIFGYGTADRFDPYLKAVRIRLHARRVKIDEIYRVENGRYWSYTCRIPECCPPGGKPFTIAPEAVAATTGVSRSVHADRDALVASLAPLGGLTRESMRQATDRAHLRLVEFFDTNPSDPHAVVHEGYRALDEFGSSSGVPRHAEMAWLSLLLTHKWVRDRAMTQLSVGQLEDHIERWTAVVRSVEWDFLAAPATILGLAAWRAGDGALANVAIARALEVDPGYTMAQLLASALAGGLSPDFATEICQPIEPPPG